jgi:alpha-L-fucosidase
MEVFKRMNLVWLLTLIFMFSFIFTVPVSSQEEQVNNDWQEMHDSKHEALEVFNNAKFGMFIHWGLYSVPAGIWKGDSIPGIGEWIMYQAQIPRTEYRKLANAFNPLKFNAEEWVKLAKEAGMKYMVVMPKHHDGFAMYNSKVTTYDVIDATPFGRDPIQELYEACQKEGMRFGIYYSQFLDWMDGGDVGVAKYNFFDPGVNKSWPANTWDPALAGFYEYLNSKAKPQMIELLEKFPGMQEIWYDLPGFTPREISHEFYKLVYDYQPNCLVNSRVGNDLGDFWIPGDNKIPAPEQLKGEIYWETPGTMNNSWGYKSYDDDWKSPEELLYWIVEIASKGGNYLLNVGPKADGSFPEESIDRLKEIGNWMNVNGEAIYGTTPWRISKEGPTSVNMEGTEHREKHGFQANFTEKDFWFTRKDNVVYAIRSGSFKC